MFTSIFQTLANAMASLLEGFINAFMGALNMDLGTYLQLFPMLESVYSVLQIIGVGLVAIIAGKKLALFATGTIESSNDQETPLGILFRSLGAAAAIFLGGYLLAILVKLGTIPYEYFRDYNAAGEVAKEAANQPIKFGEILINIVKGGNVILGGAAGVVANEAIDAATGNTQDFDLVLALFEFFVIILIVINLFKLAVEVCERYLMVGLLVFTSPIVYSTLATRESSQIFKKWFSMFISSLIMMSSSVIFLKLIISGVANLGATVEGSDGDGGTFFIRLLLIVALTKIAQRVDSYLQQIGLNAATTGGNMLDDIIGIMGSARRIASRGSILGGGGGGNARGPAALAARTNTGRAFRAAEDAFRSGASLRGAARVFGHAWRDNMFNGTALRGVRDAVNAARQNRANAGTPGYRPRSVVGAFMDGAARGTARQIAQFLAPRAMAEHDGLKTVQDRMDEMAARRKTAEATANSENRAAQQTQNANNRATKEHNENTQVGQEPLTPDQLASLEKGNIPNDRTGEANAKTHGVSNRNGEVITWDANGEATTTPEAKNAGIHIAGTEAENGNPAQPHLAGNAHSVGAAMNQEMMNGARVPNVESKDVEAMSDTVSSRNKMLNNTVEHMGPAAAGNAIDADGNVHGTREAAARMRESVERRVDESREQLQDRLSGYIAGQQQDAANGDSGTAFNVADKYFGRYNAREGEQLSAYSRVSRGVDERGIDRGNEHQLTFTDKEGNTRQMSMIDSRGYSALSTDDQKGYSTFIGADGKRFYFKAEPGADGQAPQRQTITASSMMDWYSAPQQPSRVNPEATTFGGDSGSGPSSPGPSSPPPYNPPTGGSGSSAPDPSPHTSQEYRDPPPQPQPQPGTAYQQPASEPAPSSTTHATASGSGPSVQPTAADKDSPVRRIFNGGGSDSGTEGPTVPVDALDTTAPNRDNRNRDRFDRKGGGGSKGGKGNSGFTKPPKKNG